MTAMPSTPPASLPLPGSCASTRMSDGLSACIAFMRACCRAASAGSGAAAGLASRARLAPLPVLCLRSPVGPDSSACMRFWRSSAASWAAFCRCDSELARGAPGSEDPSTSSSDASGSRPSASAFFLASSAASLATDRGLASAGLRSASAAASSMRPLVLPLPCRYMRCLGSQMCAVGRSVPVHRCFSKSASRLCTWPHDLKGPSWGGAPDEVVVAPVLGASRLPLSSSALTSAFTAASVALRHLLQRMPPCTSVASDSTTGGEPVLTAWWYSALTPASRLKDTTSCGRQRLVPGASCLFSSCVAMRTTSCRPSAPGMGMLGTPVEYSMASPGCGLAPLEPPTFLAVLGELLRLEPLLLLPPPPPPPPAAAPPSSESGA
mmetsp:Transcript_31123/g.79343  ORF Transcript_31123/g.79343 Transcript_31123/m.79343 type:complete len:379 (+) Transcript_31123:1011-2147(+)